jgi:hypothetical protein
MITVFELADIGASAFSITTFSITALKIMGLIATFSKTMLGIMNSALRYST